MSEVCAPDNALFAAVEPPAPVLSVLPTFAVLPVRGLPHPCRKTIVLHAIVVIVAFAVVDVVTGCVARHQSGGAVCGVVE